MRYDIIIVGGGIVGLATAWQLLQQKPGLRLLVLEKEDRVAAHQSSHNSGVMHSGIYYRPGSLRAQNCLRGYQLLIDFCRKNDVPFDICGKLIVAVEAWERPILDQIFEKGKQNGLAGIKKIGPDAVAEIEPHVRCLEAIQVPQAGIVNYGTVAEKYAQLIQQAGGVIETGQKVRGIRKIGDSVVLETAHATQSSWEGKLMINCGGLYSDRLTRLSGMQPGWQILPFRGEYYELKPESQHLARHLIYPVPNPNFPFLGVHFTRMIEGGIEAGPNAVLAFRREGYSRWNVHPAELAEILMFPGFRVLAKKYWRDGWEEMKRSYSRQAFVKAMQRLIPEISADDVVPGRAGVRAMACDPAGNLSDDFVILRHERIINVCNAPSPAATASLAIGETIAKLAL